MHRALVTLLAAAALLAGCSSRAPAPAPQAVVTPASAPAGPAVRCDDGGDGGVVINGVCL